MNSDLSLKITTKVTLAKYNEGQNPETDEPFELIEKEIEFTGDEAKQILDSLGGANDGSN